MTDSMNGADRPQAAFHDPELPRLVAEALEARDAGKDVDLTTLCGDRVDLLEALRASVDTGRRLGTMQSSAAQVDRYVGRTLRDRYRLVQRLGAGAMGVVYRAHDAELKRDVAVKILRATLIDAGEAQQRFMREAEVLASLDHASIVRIFDRGRTQDEDELFLVMEFVEGRTLQDLLDRRRTLPFRGEGASWLRAALGDAALHRLPDEGFLRLAVRWVADLADALQVAHDRSVFHRDVKPSNILVGVDGVARLADFGIAAVGLDSTLTREGQPLGTPAFTAPEVLSRDSQPSPALDVYGLAATLYTALAGRPPYQGAPSQVLARLAVREPDRLDRLDRTLPRDLCAVVEKGMARDPAARYSSAADFEADLRAFLDHRPTNARPVSEARRLFGRIVKSRAVRGALVALVMVAAVLGARHVSLQRKAAVRQMAFEEGLRRIPPKLGIGSQELRRASSAEEFDAVLGALDAALGCDEFLVPAGPLRAAYLHDHGRTEEAAEQMRSVARTLATPYATALAERYTALPEGSESALDLDLNELPALITSADRYLAFLHAMRVSDVGAAQAVLAEMGDEEEFALREYKLLFALQKPNEVEPRVLELERELGGRTAMTADLLGLSLTLQDEDLASYAVYREALSWVPHSYVLEENAATPAREVAGHAAAVAHCRRALAIRPRALLPLQAMVLFELNNGDIEAAQAVWGEIGATGDSKRLGARARLRAYIHAAAALEAYAVGDRERSRREAHASLQRFAEAAEHRVGQGSLGYYGLAKGLAQPDEEAAVLALVEWARLEPTGIAQVEALGEFLRRGAFDPAVSALGGYFLELEKALTHANPVDEAAFEARLRAASPARPLPRSKAQSDH